MYIYICICVYIYIHTYVYIYIYIYPRQPLPAPAVQRTLGACSCNLVDNGAGKTTKMGGECEPERRWFIIFQESHFNHQLTLTAFIN